MPAIVAALGGIRATIFACLFLITLGVLGIQTTRWDHQYARWQRERLEASQAVVQAVTRQREMERRHVAEMAAIGARYEQDKAAAEALEQDMVNGLRTGAVRLRRAWTRCEQQLSQTSATSGKRDAPTSDRAALAAALVRAGREADDQIRACQAVIRSR